MTRPHRESLLGNAKGDGDHDESSTAKAALERIVSKIGFGRFQRRLLILCGLGWMSDNMWLQAMSAIMPRVQFHFNTSTQTIGFMSSAVFVGMAVGAFFWGMFSDYRGRKLAFNLTLILSAVCGLLAAVSLHYVWLLLALALVGFGVGGNMPVDGALFLEFVPKEQQYLLTVLSVFFSFGAVLASALAWAILPFTSCAPNATHATCDPAVHNNGWRWVLGAMAAINASMFAARMLWLRMEESPRFLLAQGRVDEAKRVLLSIVHINGRGDNAALVAEIESAMSAAASTSCAAPPSSSPKDVETASVASADEQDEMRMPLRQRLQHMVSGGRLRPLFSRAWLRTTLLVWAIWILIAIAYTMFSAFLPIYLQTRGLDSDDPAAGLSGVYRGYFIYSLFSIPGPLLGGYLAETRLLGRRWTMAIGTVCTAAAMCMFTLVSSQTGMVAASAAINFFAYIVYAVIYTYTPEVFASAVRGSACGIASALGRVAGITAPALTGVLLAVSVTLPLWISAGTFVACALCMVLLPIETRGKAAE